MAQLASAASSGAGRSRQEDTSVTVQGVEIPCRITLPTASGAGAILLLPGSLFCDVDGNFPAMNLHPHVYADIAAQLGALGFTVLRMAKIGPGTGARTTDPAAAAAHLQFRTRVEVARAALGRLQARAPGARLLVAGHSEGAVVASLLAHESTDLAGVVSLSGPAAPIFGIMRRQIAGMSLPPSSLAAFDEAVAALRSGTAIPAHLAADPSVAPMAGMPPAAVGYLVSYDAVDPEEAAAAVRQPMLLIQGLRDDSVTPDNAERLKRARAGRPTTLKTFPELNHFYKRTPPGLSPMESMALSRDSDPAVAAAIAAWVASL